MRSELVMSALKHVPNRYLLTRLAAIAIRGFHRPNTRIAETANEVLLRFSLSDPVAGRPKPSSPETAELPRASRVADSQLVGLASVLREPARGKATTGERSMYPFTAVNEESLTENVGAGNR
jgi:hypothetical protein